MSGSKLFGVSCWWRLFYWSLWKKHSLWLAAFISVIIDQCYYWSVLLLISVIIGLSGKDVLCFQESQIWTKIKLHRKCKHPTKHLSVRPSVRPPAHPFITHKYTPHFSDFVCSCVIFLPSHSDELFYVGLSDYIFLSLSLVLSLFSSFNLFQELK